MSSLAETNDVAIVRAQHETNSEIDEAVMDTMRLLVKGVILFERDTLRRSVGKKRKKLSSKTFTVRQTTEISDDSK